MSETTEQMLDLALTNLVAEHGSVTLLMAAYGEWRDQPSTEHVRLCGLDLAGKVVQSNWLEHPGTMDGWGPSKARSGFDLLEISCRCRRVHDRTMRWPIDNLAEFAMALAAGLYGGSDG